MTTAPRWIWNYGDYELEHSLLLHSRRQERENAYPAMWHVDAPSKNVQFRRKFECDQAGSLTVFAKGGARVLLDGKAYPVEKAVAVAPGAHEISVEVIHPAGLPAIFVDSDVCPSGAEWEARAKDGRYQPAGCEPAYLNAGDDVEVFPFAYERMEPVSEEETDGGVLLDFGKELFGKLVIENADASKELFVVYGESRAEAMDSEQAYLCQHVSGSQRYELVSRAFRCVQILGGENLRVHALYEYQPLERRGAFTSSDPLIAKMWETCAYTFHLNSREFFLDGIKRDRWVWSGDAYQSFMINNYLFFDPALTRRTLLALRGRDEMLEHINTISDYSLYWVLGVRDYYKTTADVDFLKRLYPKMRSLMDFTASRTDENGFITFYENDWIFIDWSDFDKTGPMSAEQILYIAALETMVEVEQLLGVEEHGYAAQARELREKLEKYFWCEEKQAYIDTFASGKKHVTRHANIFAILFGIADADRARSIVQNVLYNDSIQAITTPYFKLFELDALCSQGDLRQTTDMLYSYWGGMLKLGATTIWEQYIPEEEGDAHYAMYGMAFGRSLCHAWGCGPIYLLGKYYMGVRPTAPGYATFEVAPKLGGLTDFEGTVPLPDGEVRIGLDAHRLELIASREGGTLAFNGERMEIPAHRPVVIEY